MFWNDVESVEGGYQQRQREPSSSYRRQAVVIFKYWLKKGGCFLVLVGVTMGMVHGESLDGRGLSLAGGLSRRLIWMRVAAVVVVKKNPYWQKSCRSTRLSKIAIWSLHVGTIRVQSFSRGIKMMYNTNNIYHGIHNISNPILNLVHFLMGLETDNFIYSFLPFQ